MTAPTDDRELVEKLAEEFAQRRRAGEEPSVEEYAAAHPEHAVEIRDLFPTLLMMEELASGDETPSGNPAAAVPLPGAAPAARIERVGDYRILREIGRGGMGVVYEAEQESLGRRVAVKVLPLNAARDARVLGRFRRESRAAARLHHTNIVPVFEVGQEGDIFFYAMQFIQGKPLDEVLNELRQLRAASGHAAATVAVETGSVAHSMWMGRIETAAATSGSAGDDPNPGEIAAAPAARPPSSELSAVGSNFRLYAQNVARIGHQIAGALAYAHARGIVHRDIKPSNLLLDAAGVFWVTDFGLAKTEDYALTQTGDIVGTIHYMAPERFRGEGDARADIYALGLTLYELLVLRPAFDGRDRLKLIEQISKSEPPRPREIDPRIPSDLETIVLKAIDKDPDRRYRTASEMADDLMRFVDDLPVHARRASSRERIWRSCRRNPAVASLAAAVAALLITAAVGSSWAAWRFRGMATEADLVNRQLETNLYVESIAVAHHELLASPPNIERAEKLLRECPERFRDWEWHYLKRSWLVEPTILRDAACKEVYCVAFSPDGRRLASGGSDGRVRIWDLETNEVLQLLAGHARYVFSVAFSPTDSDLIASAGGDETVKLWSRKNATALFTWPGNGGRQYGTAYGVAFSPDGRRIASGGEAGTVKVWSVATGAEVLRLAGHEIIALNVAFSPDGGQLATGDYSGVVRVWDAATGNLLWKHGDDSPPVSCVTFSRDGARLAATSFDHDVRVWDSRSGELTLSFRAHGHLALGVAFSDDGRRLATIGADQAVRIWNAVTGREMLAFRMPALMRNSVSFSPDGKRLVAADTEGVIRIWDATPLGGDEGRGLLTLKQAEEVWAMAISPDARRVAVSGENFSSSSESHLRSVPAVTIWDPWTGQRVRTLHGSHSIIVFSLAFSPDGRSLASVGDGRRRTVLVWDLETGAEKFAGERSPDARVLFAVAYSPDGRRLVAAGEDKRFYMWDAATGRRIDADGLGENLFECVDLTFSTDGAFFASAILDGTVRIWDGWRLDETPTAPRVLRVGGFDIASALAFSPNGRRLLVGTVGDTAVIVDPSSGQKIGAIHGRPQDLMCVAFSPDEEWIASSGDGCVVRLWDAKTGALLETFRGHQRPVYRVGFVFGPEGKRLVSGGRDATVKVWDLDSLKN